MLSKARRDAEFSDFVRQASAELLRIAWYLTGDAHRANDLVQAALVKTYLAWARVRPGSAIGYVRRIMVNENIDQWRRHGAEVLVDEFTEVDRVSPRDDIASLDDTTALVAALRALPAQQCRVVVLRYYCDLSEQQVAEELGISVGAVKSNGSRGLGTLRQHITEQELTHEH